MPKCSMVRRPYAPGMHGTKRRRGISEYGLQLREKQKIKRIYGILESQLKKYFKIVSAKKENINQALLNLLESRLDNVVYRVGFAPSRAKARQLVSHGYFIVNGQPVNIPSYKLEKGDLIVIKKQDRKKNLFRELEKSLKNYEPPSWISLDKEKLEVKIVDLPNFKEADLGINIQMVVEYYSR